MSRNTIQSAVALLCAALCAGCGDDPSISPIASQAVLTDASLVKPVLECVSQMGAGQYLAHFGYLNTVTDQVAVAVGPNNKFTPSPIERGQPTSFLSGRQRDVFTVSFDGSNLVWKLGSRTSTASRTSQACPTPSVCAGQPNGASCSDGNACNGQEQCESGTCKSGTPITCAVAPDSCHAAGQCDLLTGACVYPNQPAGTACSDSNKCNGEETCREGSCVRGETVTCAPPDACHLPGVCVPTTGACDYPAAPDNTPCLDGSLCNGAEACLGGVCTAGSPLVCAAAPQCMIAEACDPVKGCLQRPSPNGASCDDKNACTTGDKCSGGSCLPGTPISCGPSNGCQVPSTCNPQSGTCSTAQGCGGTCGDGQVTVNGPGVIKAVSFVWSARECPTLGSRLVVKVNGVEALNEPILESCSLANVPFVTKNVTSVLALAAFKLQGANVFEVSTLPAGKGELGWLFATVEGDISREVLVLTADAFSENSRRTNYSSSSVRKPQKLPTPLVLTDNGGFVEQCDDGNGARFDGCFECIREICGNGRVDWSREECDDGDTNDNNICNTLCKYNQCLGKVCADPPASCLTNGRCNPLIGGCQYDFKPQGAGCDDMNNCTVSDICMNGSCRGSPLTCPDDGNPCTFPATCNFFNGTCFPPSNVFNGTSCEDRNACTELTRCNAGTCEVISSTQCPVSTDPCLVGKCDPLLGCSLVPAPEGSGCNDGNPCTTGEQCLQGSCRAGTPAVCPTANGCLASKCNSTTGACESSKVPDWTSCNDNDLCTLTDVCRDGVCAGTNKRTCLPTDSCHVAACEPTTGSCVEQEKPDGAQCSDGDRCTPDDVCFAGACTGGPSFVCESDSKCRLASVCNKATGQCLPAEECGPCGNRAVDPGEGCDDGNVQNGDGCSSTCTLESCGDSRLSWLPPRKVELTWLTQSCSGALTIAVSINGVEVARVQPPPSCACTSSALSTEIDRFAIIKTLRDGLNAVTLKVEGAASQDKVAWAVLSFSGVRTEELVLFDAGTSGDAVARRGNICQVDSATGVLQVNVQKDLDLYEECDDGNLVAGDGCSETCANECAQPACGNGTIESPERCDDGNQTSLDGCSNTCEREL